MPATPTRSYSRATSRPGRRLATLLATLSTNDAAVVILTEPLVRLCLDLNLHPEPFLVAPATSANIGCVPTPIGNPQGAVDIYTYGSLLLNSSSISVLLILDPATCRHPHQALEQYRLRQVVPADGACWGRRALGELFLAAALLPPPDAHATPSFSSQLSSFKASWSEGLVGGRESEIEQTSSASEKVAQRSMSVQRVMFILTILAMLAALRRSLWKR